MTSKSRNQYPKQGPGPSWVPEGVWKQECQQWQPHTLISSKSQAGNLGINLNNAAQMHSKGSSTICTLSGRAHKWNLFHPRITHQHLTTCLELECVIEKRTYSSFTKRFPLQPWVFGLSIVIMCNTNVDAFFLGGCSASAEAPQTWPEAGGSSDRDKSWGWAPATCSSQHLWETCTQVSWDTGRRHSKAPVRATSSSINRPEEPCDSSGKLELWVEKLHTRAAQQLCQPRCGSHSQILHALHCRTRALGSPY